MDVLDPADDRRGRRPERDILALNAEQSGYADVDGANIFYETMGSGHPLVLVHSEGLDRRVWDDQTVALAERYRVVRYDRRFWGRTLVDEAAPPVSNISEAESAWRWLEQQPAPPAPYEDLRGLLDHLGIEHAYLLGLSDGGVECLDLAIEHPERVDALVLVDTTIPSTGSLQQQEKAVERGIQKATDIRRVLEVALRDKDVMAVVDWSLEDPSYAASTQTTRQRLREICADNASSILFPRGRYDAALDPPAGERLDEIEAPTLLVVTGETDPDLGEFDEALARGIPKSTKLELTHASPTLNMDRPEEFNNLVTEFLEKL